ncbi:MAG: hypothetical protein OEN50_05940 [Deltaproteobacteria bacterium]|nr:hypothetical protein [Deltaproteobacteria bacterium]
MFRGFNLLAVAITAVYPLALWWGHEHFEPRVLGILLLLVVLARLHTLRASRAARWLIGGTLLLLGFALWANVMLPLKLYPVLVNMALLGVFAYSLVFPPSVVERLARMSEPDLPPAAMGYTRRVTQIWCGFFAANGAVALITAIWASPTIWWLYNGLIAYLAIGLLFAGEYCVRLYVRRRENV